MISLLPERGPKGRKRRIVLPSGLPNRSAHHDLEYLVFAETCTTRGVDVFVRDPTGTSGNLVGQRAKWFGETAVVERCPTLGGRRLTGSFQNSLYQRCSRLSDI
ncbi:hypothetical protein [Alloacidobacterium sp.]|uniref:hypothetical protein n=1 Tax=Alloacidobacterium sp. TaxID=2951999 RepID=UPI002D72F8DB|nr:hypothetical protein [Alloacidobacterium sp.]HYK36385.1 hypothetical protein [Alloacidobacterium sp.]